MVIVSGAVMVLSSLRARRRGRQSVKLKKKEEADTWIE
jgi:hypothetical protein